MRVEKEDVYLYDKYVGKFCKRFYRPFEEDAIFSVEGFGWDTERNWMTVRVRNGAGDEWYWDFEDTIIITDHWIIEDEYNIANVNDKRYIGYNPFTKQVQ